MSSQDDELGKYLEDGWEVCGYSASVLALGSTTQNILLRKGTSLAHCMISNIGAKEVARGVTVLSPRPDQEKKKGFFG